ncbi:hypothetical protein PF66_06214 [Pseudomonas asplenii]|uniref:Uncharacterized protein n=1 Tax=Pseudomonas asplenii TaxID=53407 RepID=A0A0N0E156_9PSED|nr:hypothetical protein [Pseudomonas fuscovaginae]KPA87304.1 hypothetical protein PF66_06214 [Pseudomonas fuscovaginae]
MAKPDEAAPQETTQAASAPAAHTSTVDGIAIDGSNHFKAKELFASLLAHAEEDVKVIAREIGSLLHLHTAASGQADTTGDYKAGDVAK